MRRFLVFSTATVLLAWSSGARAATVLETATMGAPGQVGGGAVISSSSWFGAVFSLDAQGEVTSVGAHLRSTSPGLVFAAVLPIDEVTGLPACLDLSCAVAVETGTPSDPSAELVVPLQASLPAGDYALLFGSGAAGASGEAVAPLNDPMVGTPTFMGRVFFGGEFIWVAQTGQIDARFFLELAVCGDAQIDPGEECDDGNEVDTDACLSTCEAAFCGDGQVHEGVEACDPQRRGGPMCTRRCTLDESMETGSSSGTTGDDGSTSSGDWGSSTTTEGPIGTSTGSGPSDSSGVDGSTSGNGLGDSSSTSLVPGTSSSGDSSGSEGSGQTSEAIDDDSSVDGCSCRSGGATNGLGLLFLSLLFRRRR